MTSTSTIKKFTFVFDVICALLALVLISFGIYLLCSYDLNEIGKRAAYLYIGLGTATLVVFLLGLLGAVRESVCCTVTFVTLLWIVILAQIATTFFLLTAEDTTASHLANTLDKAWDEELTKPGAMAMYENWLKCCGRASPHDYIVSDRLPPNTCFQNNDSTKSENLIAIGCRIQFENYWLNLLRAFNIIACVMIVLELIGSVISCCLCNSMRNDHRRSFY